MLPDGVAYATDKAFKYLIKFYLIQNSKDNNIFYFKRSDKAMNPLDLAATYLEVFKKEVKDDGKQVILKNLLSCLDVRMFGATFAPKGAGIDKKNISIHGPVQICHGMNRFPESIIFSEQIMSPFANQKDKKKDDSTENDEEVSKASMTTLGSQSKLREGHYVHHFSINPKNLTTHINQAGDGAPTLTEDDIKKLKEAMRRGATNYDSAAKAGTENEFLLWVQLKQDSNIVLPNFTPLVEIPKEKTADGKVKINLTKIKTLLNREGIKGNIEKVEYYFNPDTTSVEGTDEGWWEKHETL
jgi:CRISPR-associated protein Csh2